MSNEPHDTQLKRSVDTQSQSWLGRNRVWLVVAVLIGVGLALGWDWLVAANLLTFAFAMIGCLLMFAMCMRGSKGDGADE
ncbi:MAG: hypothetical protein RIE14_04415 [Salinisphaeraceae bacterium]|uniref:Uncharacterized protein n=1 Tax=Spectribacter hydrogenoxidans TaxID=3075608 RepID=A0ABU3C2Z6_9GAMM|nr:hypothetical protein [Salinisphaera sp. W335]MDT0635933.1 hypothetical protein [Salinisphaera sp. W335]